MIPRHRGLTVIVLHLTRALLDIPVVILLVETERATRPGQETTARPGLCIKKQHLNLTCLVSCKSCSGEPD